MESAQDMLSRVQGMAAGEDTWDLSDNDCAALKHVLAKLSSAEEKAEELRKVSLCEIRDCSTAKNQTAQAVYERDQLRASLAAAEERAAKAETEAYEYIDYRNKAVLERDDLAATVAGLRGALEEIGKLEPWKYDQAYAGGAFLSRRVGVVLQESLTPIVEAALAASPAEHAARLKATALAEYIDDNGTTCDCCQHVLIDVTAAENGEQGHCTAGDPEGDGSGCAWGWHEDADRRELRLKAEWFRELSQQDYFAVDQKERFLIEADRLEKAVVK